MIHTNAIAYGFLANAFLGTLHWAVPRLTFRTVASRALSWFIFGAWQVIVVATAAGIVLGPSLQDQPWVAELRGSGRCPWGWGRRAWSGVRRRSGSTRSRWSVCFWWR